jgi:hypothetical protein
MKTPSQLALDFVNDNLPEHETQEESAQVVSLDEVRQSKHRSAMRSVYDSILQSVQHIGSHPPKRRRSWADSSFG